MTTHLGNQATHDSKGYRIDSNVEPVSGLITKTINGTTPSTQGGTLYIDHGLNYAKIVSVSLKIEYAASKTVPDSWAQFPGYEVYVQWDSTRLLVQHSEANSGNVLSKPFVATIWYEA